MKTWEVLNKFKDNDIIDILLQNRGIKTKKDKEAFLDPLLEDVNIKSVGIDEKELKKALTRIQKAIKNQEQIVVFGDYDVDGITGAAILWETLHSMNAKVMPYIPHRIDEGYGLSEIGITNVKSQLPEVKLIITDDNGIVAHDAVDFANKIGIDVIITDHHVPPDGKLPKALAIVHTTNLCGAGVAYMLSQTLKPDIENSHLELAALGTIADMVPLTGANRTIVRHGLLKLSKTARVGLLELFKQAGFEKNTFTVYEVGYIIAPRLNAAGRIESAMESLRLLCTKDQNRARALAEKLELINRERQLILKSATEHAINSVQNSKSKGSLLFVADESYQQGVIGLIAGKLVQEFYRPSIVLSIGETHSKASGRSIGGFDLIEFLRTHEDHFVNVGGHPMAAGFTIETAKLKSLQKILVDSAEKIITEELLKRSLKIDCELPFSKINQSLYEQLQALSPFGIGNPEPTFVSNNVAVVDFKWLGKDKNHLKLWLKQKDSEIFEAIAFGALEIGAKIKKGDKIDVAYTLDNNSWNGNTKLQLKIKDIKLNE